jgi:hypothetical protein
MTYLSPTVLNHGEIKTFLHMVTVAGAGAQ